MARIVVLEKILYCEKENPNIYEKASLTWQKQRLFEYEQFTGHIDIPRKNLKYVKEM